MKKSHTKLNEGLANSKPINMTLLFMVCTTGLRAVGDRRRVEVFMDIEAQTVKLYTWIEQTGEI